MSSGKVIKPLFFAALFICIALLSACGAIVDTKFTADMNFKGERIITVTLARNDFEQYAGGGVKAIEEVIIKYLPAQMTYDISLGEDALVCLFTVPFDGIDDYRTKIDQIFAADPSNAVQPVIEYKNSATAFKSGVSLDESFTSLDLLGWLKYGLRAEGLIKRSEVEWFEIGKNEIIFDDKDYECYTSHLAFDEAQRNYVYAIDVTTRLLADGAYNREIKFACTGRSLEELREYGFDIDAYFNSLLVDGCILNVTGDSSKAYIIEMNGFTMEQIISATNKIMMNDKTEFVVSVLPSELDGDEILIDVYERIDASYYVEPYFINFNTNYNIGIYHSTRLNATGEVPTVSSFTFRPEFLRTGAVTALDGTKLDFALELYFKSNVLPLTRKILMDRALNSMPADAAITEQENGDLTVYTVTFGSEPRKIAADYNAFMYNLTGEKTTCYIAFSETLTNNPLKKAALYEITVDGATSYRTAYGANVAGIIGVMLLIAATLALIAALLGCTADKSKLSLLFAAMFFLIAITAIMFVGEQAGYHYPRSVQERIIIHA